MTSIWGAGVLVHDALVHAGVQSNLSWLILRILGRSHRDLTDAGYGHGQDHDYPPALTLVVLYLLGISHMPLRMPRRTSWTVETAFAPPTRPVPPSILLLLPLLPLPRRRSSSFFNRPVAVHVCLQHHSSLLAKRPLAKMEGNSLAATNTLQQARCQLFYSTSHLLDTTTQLSCNTLLPISSHPYHTNLDIFASPILWERTKKTGRANRLPRRTSNSPALDPRA